MMDRLREAHLSQQRQIMLVLGQKLTEDGNFLLEMPAPLLNLSLGYQLKTSDNVGFDQNIQVSPAELVEDTEYGDSSYEEDRFRINLSYPLPLEAPWDWELGLDYQRRIRYYQSELNLSDDPFHTGREDDRILITPSIKFSSSFDLDFKLEYTYDQRDTDSPEPSVSSVKNFKNHTIELTVTYQIL